MSSARNHAKRSHRSYHNTKAAVGAAHRRMYIRRVNSPKQFRLFKALTSFFNRRKTNQSAT